MIDQDVRRATRLLEALLKMRKVRARDLERRLGYGAGTLDGILSGKVEVKLQQILAILEDLDVRPAAFFRIAYEEMADPSTAEQLRGLLQRAGLSQRFEPVVPGPVSRGELDSIIAEVLQRYGVEPPDGEAPPGPPPENQKPAKPKK
jgi:hypothetical protein